MLLVVFLRRNCGRTETAFYRNVNSFALLQGRESSVIRKDKRQMTARIELQIRSGQVFGKRISDG